MNLLFYEDDDDRNAVLSSCLTSLNPREHDCIWCMACVTVCPTTAIKVEEANLDIHKKMAETTG